MTESKSYDVVGIGSAIVDVLAQVEDPFLDQHGLTKGAMALIDQAQAAELYAALLDPITTSGGSTSNTMAGLASLGGSGAFIGKVADDAFGKIFSEQIAEVGTDFLAKPVLTSAATAQSVVLVSPDAQRTMNTYLGVAGQLEVSDVPTEAVAASKIFFVEGYLWDSDTAPNAISVGVQAIKAAGGKVAFSLSDFLCVERHRQSFLDFLDDVDILFANEAEATALFETDLDSAIASLAEQVAVACITRSEQGSVIVAEGERFVIEAESVSQVVDTTGAGDQYAAGVLFGIANGHQLQRCGQIGAVAAAEVISHLGPRPETSLADLVAKEVRS